MLGLHGRAGGKPTPTAPPEAAETRGMLVFYGRAEGTAKPTAPPEPTEATEDPEASNENFRIDCILSRCCLPASMPPFFLGFVALVVIGSLV